MYFMIYDVILCTVCHYCIIRAVNRCLEKTCSSVATALCEKSNCSISLHAQSLIRPFPCLSLCHSVGLRQPRAFLIRNLLRRIQCYNRIFCIWINIPQWVRERVKRRVALWPLSRAENLLWQLSLMFVQAVCHEPVWALCKHQGCHGFWFYQWGNMQSDRPLPIIRNRSDLTPVITSPCY